MRKPFSGKLTAIAALTQLPFLVLCAFVWDFESRSDAGFALFFCWICGFNEVLEFGFSWDCRIV